MLAARSLARAARGARLSTTPPKLDRAARKAARGGAAPATRDDASTTALWTGVATTTAVLSAGIYSLMADPRESQIAEAVQASAPGRWIVANVAAMAAPFVDPVRDKLLPDWPPDYLNLAPDVPCPHTLVLDLDDTLVTATWDRKHGWRHAKRPGVEEFLRVMAKHYEIVLFTSNVAGVADPVVNALDREGCAMHRLYRDATRFVRGTHCKDLTKLNRPLGKIVLVDKDRKACQLNPGHAIIVEPYRDASDRTDTALEDLTPLLCALVNENVKDVPAALAKFSSTDAATVATEYARMLQETKTRTSAIQNVGLGGFVRGRAEALREQPAGFSGGLAASGLSARDIAGDAPESKPKKGRLFAFWDRKTKEAEAEQKQKMEAWQRVMQKKEAAKRLAADA